MVEESRNIRSLSIDELSEVIDSYPWFAQARRVLCEKMSSLGEVWTEDQYAEAALHICSRRIIYNLQRRSRDFDYSDKEIGELLDTYFTRTDDAPGAKGSGSGYRGVGDYFSKSDYQDVREGDDNIYSSFVSKKSGHAEDIVRFEDSTEFCTETLAQVYLEQGFPSQAKSIYSKLMLRYPEKSAYFASLIEKIDKII